MNKTALKIAVSPLVMGLTMVGCSTTETSMFRPAAESAKVARVDEQASRYFDLAQQALQKGDTSSALGHAERAVELSPRDAGYRMLLGDLYLKSGRFVSAETAFSDVLTLNPGNSRATFSLVLAEIALGKQGSALIKLDRLSQTASAADVGLAYALAGYPDRAVAMLEGAARLHGADGRVRQNLALAYALSGDWQRARVTAAQDLSPADLAGRMEQWASFVQPSAQWDQVASLLGVTPAQDSGQPIRLALAPAAPQPAVYAQAEVQAALEAPVPESVQYAAVQAPVESVQYQDVTPAAVQPEPKAAPVWRASTPSTPAQPKKVLKQASRGSTGTGRFVVQLASYGSPADLQQGWSQLQKRYGLGSYAPLSAAVTLPGKGRFHRLSVAGFGSQSEAASVCGAIKGKGGACFVRTISGDAPLRWASRNVAKPKA